MRDNPYKMLGRKERPLDEYGRRKELEALEQTGMVGKKKPKDLTKTPVEELSEDSEFLDKVFGK